MPTIMTVDHNYAARDTKRMNAYDQHQPAKARMLRPRDTKPWKAQTAENTGAPITNITLSGSTVAGSAASGTTIGTFAAVGGKAPWTIAVSDYSGKLAVFAGVLKTNVAPPIPAGSYPITCTMTDAAGQVFSKGFSITVT
jgi:hypothetical protein